MPRTAAVELMNKHKTNDPFKIAKQKGILVLFEPLGKTLGYYNRYKRISFIHINNSIDEGLQKFVCAHELGHAVLHHDANTPFLKRKTLFSTERIEIEANKFATELLIPDDLIMEHSYLTIYEIARIANVPIELAYLKDCSFLEFCKRRCDIS